MPNSKIFDPRAQNSRRKRQGGAVAALPALLAAVLSGCAHGVGSTTIQPDGAWTRTVTYHGQKAALDGSAGMGSTIQDAFVLPSGPGWKITHADTKDEAVIVAERTLELGGTIHGDITARGGAKNPATVAINDVTVKPVAPGVYQYTETLHWTGPAPKDLTPDGEAIAVFKKALPPALATDANARDLAAQSIRDLWKVFFGPGDPLISQISSLMTEPELAERRVQKQIGASLMQHMEVKFGAQMTLEQRRAAAHRIIHDSLFNVTAHTKNAGPGGDPNAKSGDDTAGTSLFLSVKLPGRITDTNGERDDVAGEVYWALYPEAAAIGDVTMTATCDTNRAGR